MSFYSSGDVSTKYLDPKSFIDGGKGRAVYDFKNAHHLAYLPNMRLLNLGIFGQADGVPNRLIGLNSLITNISLQDGRQDLTKLKKFGLYRGFQLSNTDNNHAMSVVSRKACAQVGFQEDNLTGLLEYNILPVQSTQAARGADGVAAGNGADFATIELREVLPMLNSVSHLPSDVFQNLRLVIDFDTSPAGQHLADITNTITGLEFPVLAIDVIDNKSIVDKMTRALGNRISWLEIEHDQVVFEDGNAGANNVETISNEKLDGFRNKSVERVLQIKEEIDPAKYLNGNAVLGYGRYQSPAVFNEKLQVRLNGRNLFPQSGMTGAMERLGYLVDLYGEQVLYPGANQVDIDPGTIVGPDQAGGTALGGNKSYNAFYVGDRVMDLQIEHKRTSLHDTTNLRPSTDALNVHYFAEVKKGLVIGNGGYNIVYL